ncbi:hypothetical protein [Amycolatopsis sp. NPDC058986]|uniref:hypothetical protein n=1 Tax=unclassified Amycolatopsis TaxID=2618356 RepID=UPI003671EFB1
MLFSEVVRDLGRHAQVHHAQAAIRAVHGASAARWLADYEGISRRTARRWLSASYPRARAHNIIRAASDASGLSGLAAQRLRRATRLDVGTVDVEYDGDPQKTRTPGPLDVTPTMANYLTTAANALDRRDLETAGDAFSRAVMHGYEPGLEDTLYIAGYDANGVDLEE